MGQKVHPLGVRLGFTKTWEAKWFSKKNVPDFIQEDIGIRGFVKKKLFSAGIGKIIIERAGKALRVNIYTARPGLIIGKKGADIEALRMDIEQFSDSKININIIPIKKPELNGQIVAEDIAQQLLKRGAYRRILKKSISRTMMGGANGIKVKVGGRLGGAEIARTEWMKEGRIPLQTLRADIDYGFAESNTTFGKIGVKVWIFIETEGSVKGMIPVEKTAGNAESDTGTDKAARPAGAVKDEKKEDVASPKGSEADGRVEESTSKVDIVKEEPVKEKPEGIKTESEIKTDKGVDSEKDNKVE